MISRMNLGRLVWPAAFLLLTLSLGCGSSGSPGAPKPLIIIGSSSIWGELSPCG